MKKLKLLTIFGLLGFMLFGGMNVPKVSAASPGCYEASGLADRPNYQRVDCGSDILNTQVRIENLCLVRSSSGGTFRSADCSSFEVGVNNNSSPTESGETGEVPPSPPREDVGGKEELSTDCDPGEGVALSAENCGIIDLLVTAINVLSALAGMAIIASMMIAGYQYMTAQDNAGQIQKARTRIVWALTALALFIFGYALLNYLVPGGVL